MYYYEVIECCRRIILTAFLVFVAPNTATQTALPCIFALACLLVFEFRRPYLDSASAWLYRLVRRCSRVTTVGVNALLLYGNKIVTRSQCPRSCTDDSFKDDRAPLLRCPRPKARVYCFLNTCEILIPGNHNILQSRILP